MKTNAELSSHKIEERTNIINQQGKALELIDLFRNLKVLSLRVVLSTTWQSNYLNTGWPRHYRDSP